MRITRLSALQKTYQICFFILVSSKPSKVNSSPDRLADLMIKESCPATPKITVRSLICENGTGAQDDLPVLQYLVQNNNGELEDPPSKHFQCGKRMEITISCQASQPITWTYDGPKAPHLHRVIALSKASRTTSGEWSENATFCSEMSFSVNITTDVDITGIYTCALSDIHNSTYPNILSSKHTHSKQKSFLYLFWNETQKTELLGKTGFPGSNHPEVIIPCQSNESSSPVTLEKLELQSGGFRAVTTDELDFTYENLVGFHWKWNPTSAEDIRGTYKCANSGSEVEFVVNSKFEIYEKAKRSDDIQIRVYSCGMDNKYMANCSSDSGRTELKMQILECENPIHCSLLWEASPQYLKNMPVYEPRPFFERNCETQIVLEPKQSGVIICSTKDGEKYQYGNYFLEEFVVDETETAKQMLFSSARAPLILTSPVSMKDNMERVQDAAKYIYITYLLNISCNATQYLFSDGVRLGVKYENGSIGPAEVLASTKKSSNGYYRHEWLVNVTSIDIKNYICMAPLLDSSEWVIKSTANISIRYGKPPVLLKDQTSPSEVTFYDDATDVKISCAAKGLPQPEFKWYKNGNIWKDWIPPEEFPMTYDTIEVVTDKTEPGFTIGWLEIPKVKNLGMDVGGTWTCNASNNFEPNASHEIYVEVTRRPFISTPIIIAITFIGVACVVVVIFHRIYMEHRIKKLREMFRMSEEDQRRFLYGDASLVSLLRSSANLSGRKIARFLLYQKERYEVLNPSDVVKDSKKPEVLGRGNFGMVIKGRYRQLNGEMIPVAIKMPKKDDYLEAEMLQEELKILAYVGEHRHIVRLVGAVTTGLVYGQIQVLLEYCETTLDRFLRKHQVYFCDEIRNDRICYSRNSSCETTGNSQGKNVTRSSGYVQIDFSGLKFRTFDLVRWAYQISCAMQYLISRKIIHRDLAPRNILIKDVDGKERGDIKIADFGLSKKMRKKQEEYTKIVGDKGSDVKLPWRHLAPELFKEAKMVFAESTDVWSFGVTLWEMFSLAETLPYSDFSDCCADFIIAIKYKNYRNPKPKYATTSIYNTMLRCWDPQPSHRPTFTDLTRTFLNLLPNDYVSTIPQNVYEPPKFNVGELEPLLPKPRKMEALEMEKGTAESERRNSCCKIMCHA